MRFNSLVAASALIALAAIPSARAEMVSISAVGALNLTSLSVDPSADTSSGVGFGFGALVAVPVAPLFSIESGVLYVTRKYSLSTAPVSIDQSLNQLEIPLLLRLNAIPMLSVGVGGYFALGLGDVHNSIANVSSDQSYDLTGLSKTDLGLLASVAVNVPVAPTIGLLVDARYLLGLKDVSTSDLASTKFRDFQLLAGVNFSL